MTAEGTSTSRYGTAAYLEPQCYIHDIYVRDEKSDIYSLGVLFWEISSGCPPFLRNQTHNLTSKIAEGFREKPIKDTPQFYAEPLSEMLA